MNFQPELVDQWHDPHDNILNSLFIYPNGVRLVVAENPATIDFDISVIMHGGSYFERQSGVPQGTAHFLEHIFAGNPNRKFKTRQEMDAFRFGTKTRPSIGYNAGTGKRTLSFYVYGNEQGAERMTEYLHNMVHYPLENVESYIEKERQVILAEYQRLKPEDKDPALAADKFILGDKYPEFTARIIGTGDSIREVSIENIQQFQQRIFGAENVVIAVQAKQRPQEQLQEMINAIAEGYSPLARPLEFAGNTLENSFRYATFNDPQRQGMFLSVFTLQPYQPEYVYENIVRTYLFRRLVNKVGFDYLREEKGLVYSVDTYKGSLTWDWDVIGFRAHCELPKFGELLNESIDLFQRGINFLQTPQGENWFNGEISGYIFDRTTQFDPDYAEDVAADVLRGKYKYDYEQAKMVARNTTIPELIDYIEANFINIPPHIWTESAAPESEVLDTIAQSGFAKHYTAPNA